MLNPTNVKIFALLSILLHVTFALLFARISPSFPIPGRVSLSLKNNLAMQIPPHLQSSYTKVESDCYIGAGCFVGVACDYSGVIKMKGGKK